MVQIIPLIISLPFRFSKHLISKLRRIEEPDLREQNVWIDQVRFNDYLVQCLAVSNEEAKNIFNLQTLNFPKREDWDDPFRFLMKYRTQPELIEIENSFFDEVYLKTELGIFLIRINEKGNGMTLCLLPASQKTLIEVTQLKSLSWVIDKQINDGIQLFAYANKGKHVVDVKLISRNNTSV